jgi:hypothetical protein
MELGTPQIDLGQAIDTAYGWHETYFYRRTIELTQEGPIIEWARADEESAAELAESGYCAGAAFERPRVARWTPCADPEGARHGR